jgi:chitinase
LLTAAVSPSKKVIDEGYNVPLLNEYLDHINVMTYDFYGHWDKQTGHVAPLYHHPDAATFEFNAVRLFDLTLFRYSIHFHKKKQTF